MTEMSSSGISQYDKEFLSAAVFMGMLVGGLLGGFVSDRKGRKPCLAVSLLINAIAGLASSFAPDVNALVVVVVIVIIFIVVVIIVVIIVIIIIPTRLHYEL